MAGAAGLLMALAGVLAAPTASAAGDAPADKATPRGAGMNCTVNVETKATRCFETATQAISHASGGQITSAPSSASAAVQDPKLTKQINDLKAPAVLIGIQYYWQNYGTPSLYFWGSSPCTTSLGNVDYQYGPLPTIGGINWNNNIRSFVGYNNCWERLYDYSNCTGSYYGYAGYSADLGWFRDRANCIRWS